MRANGEIAKSVHGQTPHGIQEFASSRWVLRHGFFQWQTASGVYWYTAFLVAARVI